MEMTIMGLNLAEVVLAVLSVLVLLGGGYLYLVGLKEDAANDVE